MASKVGKTIICLLRNDLRFHDNQVLLWAHQHADHILPLYCFDPRHIQGTWHFGFPKTGRHRLKFNIETVDDLRKTLKSKGCGLVVRIGKPEDVITELVKKLQKENVAAVTYQEEVTKEELDVEKAIKNTCGVTVKTFWGATLYTKDDLPFPVRSLPDVYSQFRQKVENKCNVRPVVSMPTMLKPLPPGVDEGSIPSMADLGFEDSTRDLRTAIPFSGGETHALARLNDYLASGNVATYKETRNGMIGSEFSTKFSIWLANGSLSPKMIYAKIKEYEREEVANQSTYWVIFELIWRDYFRYVGLKYGDRLFYLNGIQGQYGQWKQDMKLFKAWQEGRTGVPYVDANMREMAATGFMSNRGRQNVASFLTKDLKLDWRLGAEWFESVLVDHDVCSNYGNWQYSAGVGNDPRQNRKFNMVKQGLDYDPEGAYVRLWVPELNGLKTGDAHVPWTLRPGVLQNAGVSLGENYPNPIVIAPEWSRHTNKPKSGRGRNEPPKGQQRGIDFYFKNSNPK